MRTIEATIDPLGNVHLLEPLELPQIYSALVTILEEKPLPRKLRPVGLAKGQFVVPEDFDAPFSLIPPIHHENARHFG